MCITTIKFEPQDKEELYKMKCQKCGKYFKSVLINPHKLYQCTKCGYKNDEKCFTKETKIAYDTKAKEIIEIIKECSKNLTKQECENIKILGEYGWSFYFNDVIDMTTFGDTAYFLPKQIKSDELSNTITIKEIDEFFSNFIKINHLSEIEYRLYNRCNDKIKIKKVFECYKNKNFYECTTLLFGLIDSEIIKAILYDLKNKSNASQNISQGWQAFYTLYDNNFKSSFNNKTFKNKGKDKRISFNNFVNEVREIVKDDICFEFFMIAYPLSVFFDDSDWKNFPIKPNVINRNWLMHGMYDYNDITEIDCKKLITYYYSLTNFMDKFHY